MLLTLRYSAGIDIAPAVSGMIGAADSKLGPPIWIRISPPSTIASTAVRVISQKYASSWPLATAIPYSSRYASYTAVLRIGRSDIRKPWGRKETMNPVREAKL